MEPTIETKYKTEIVPIEIEYKGQKYTGEARPLASSCRDGVCFELDVTLNNEILGTIHRTSGGWKMDKMTDQGFVDAIGEEIFLWYE
jgi:hypothetical protein